MFKEKAMKLKIAMNNGRLTDLLNMSTQFVDRRSTSDTKVARRKGFQSSVLERDSFDDSGKFFDQTVDIANINKQI